VGTLLEEFGLAIHDGVPVRQDRPDAALVIGVVVLGIASVLVIGTVLRSRWIQRRKSSAAGERTLATAVPPRATNGKGYLVVGMVTAASIVGASIVWSTSVLERSMRCAGYLASEVGGGSALRVSGAARDDHVTQAARAALIGVGCPIIRPTDGR